jgi:hypothetical protein
MTDYPPSTSSPITVITQECAAYLVSTNGSTHTGMLRQKGTEGEGAALSASSDNASASAVLVNGVEKQRGTVKISHKGYADGSDAWAAGLSVDLRTAGTAAQGIFVTATDGPTRGNLIVLRNNGVDDLVVKGSGRVGLGVGMGMSPAGTLEVVQRDTTAPAIVISSQASQGNVLEVTRDGSRRVCEIDANGNVRVSSIRITSDPASDLGTGLLFVDSDGWLKFRGGLGTVTKLAAP